MKKQTHQFLFVAIVLIGLLLRTFSLKTNGLWIDELWSMLASASKNSVSQIIEACANDTHPPLFDILLHYVLVLFNDAEYAGRYLALLLGMIGLIASYFYGKQISQNKEVGLLTMAIVSFNHFHILYSIEGRFYTLIYLFSIIIIGEFYLFLKHGKTSSLIKYVLVSILLVYTHYYGGILIASLSIIALALLLLKQIDWKSFWKFCLGSTAILISFLPWLPNMLDKNTGSSWMNEPSIGDFFNYYYLYSGKNPLEFALLLIPLLLLFRILKNDKILLWTLYGNILLGFIIPYIASHIGTPLLHKRYTFIYLPSIYLMTALFWYKVKKVNPKVKKISYAAILAFTFINILLLRKEYKDDQKGQWKEVSTFVESQNPRLAVYAEHSRYFNFYLKDKAGDLNELRESKPGTFWLLKTNYDQQTPIEEMQLIVLETKTFPKYFEIYKVKKP